MNYSLENEKMRSDFDSKTNQLMMKFENQSKVIKEKEHQK